MTDVSMSATDVLEHMKNGAKLYRGFADKIELRIPNKGTVMIPAGIFDSLRDEKRIVSESGEATGFYKLP